MKIENIKIHLTLPAEGVAIRTKQHFIGLPFNPEGGPGSVVSMLGWEQDDKIVLGFEENTAQKNISYGGWFSGVVIHTKVSKKTGTQKLTIFGSWRGQTSFLYGKRTEFGPFRPDFSDAVVTAGGFLRSGVRIPHSQYQALMIAAESLNLTEGAIIDLLDAAGRSNHAQMEYDIRLLPCGKFSVVA